MIAVQLLRVGIGFGALPVFEELSWQIHNDRVTGLVGPNGCGKSTLLRLVCGELVGDSGSVVRSKGLAIGYLPQEPALPAGFTVFGLVRSAFTALQQILNELEQVETSLADPVVYTHPGRLSEALERQARLLETYTALGGPGFEGRLRSLLLSFGFDEAAQALPVQALSGGQRKLAALACLVVQQPNLLLLDEPDNHLDLDGKALLENFIRSFSGGVVIVSHDRYLLDLVVDEIAELEAGRLALYPGNYSEFAFEKQTRLLRQQQLYQAQQKEITRLEQSAKRLLTWGRVYDNEKFITRGFNILKRLERMEKIDQPMLERRQMGLALQGWRGSNKVLELRGLSMEFPAANPKGKKRLLFSGLDLEVRHGERLGLVGPNGAGKSVLLKLILGSLQPSKGEVRLGPSVQAGYYAQLHETLEYGRTLIDSVRQAAALSESQTVAFLNRFLFTYEQQRGRVGELSGGERSRLQLALLMLSGANFLLLDEPTNNLDIASAEVLEDAVQDFEGSAVIISHDRYFLDRVATRLLELKDGEFNLYEGGYSQYQAKRHGLSI